MPDKWTRNDNASTEEWRRNLEAGIYGYISQYAYSETYCWQAVRGDFRLSGLAEGKEAAIQTAEETLALPIDEFNRRVTVNLIGELREVERKIHALSPNMDILPGYQAGFEAGAADIKRRIAAAMDEDLSNKQGAARG
jgi:hypothetical protein